MFVHIYIHINHVIHHLAGRPCLSSEIARLDSLCLLGTFIDVIAPISLVVRLWCVCACVRAYVRECAREYDVFTSIHLRIGQYSRIKGTRTTTRQKKKPRRGRGCVPLGHGTLVLRRRRRWRRGLQDPWPRICLRCVCVCGRVCARGGRAGGWGVSEGERARVRGGGPVWRAAMLARLFKTSNHMGDQDSTCMQHGLCGALQRSHAGTCV